MVDTVTTTPEVQPFLEHVKLVNYSPLDDYLTSKWVAYGLVTVQQPFGAPKTSLFTMGTTTQNHVINIDYDVNSAASSLLEGAKSAAVGLYCWWKGYERVNARQEAEAIRLDLHSDCENMADLDTIAPRDGEDKGSPRRVSRRRRAPFAAWLVQTIRGSHLSQCSRTEASVLVFERHARALMAEQGVRPTDAAAVLPYATSLFFDHRTVDQIDAVAITHTDVFKSSVKKYEARYFFWGRAAAKAEA